MTLDQAQDAFRDRPSRATAGNYLVTAIGYRRDNMIGPDTYTAIAKEVFQWLTIGRGQQ